MSKIRTVYAHFCSLEYSYRSRVAVWQIRMCVSFAVTQLVAPYFSHVVAFLRLVPVSVK